MTVVDDEQQRSTLGEVRAQPKEAVDERKHPILLPDQHGGCVLEER
jgi:hypothetical protein